MTCILATLSICGATWPSEIPAADFALGRAWAKQYDAGWRAAASVQLAIGYWFDGRQKRQVEFVWTYSPKFVARRLGFLSRAGNWRFVDAEDRWARIRQAVGEDVIFYFLLTAAPRIDPLDGIEADRAITQDLDDIRVFLVGSGEPASPSSLTLRFSTRSRDAAVFDRFPWHQFAPGGLSLVGDFEQMMASSLVPVGDYHVRLWEARFSGVDVSQARGETGSFSIEILSKNKRRVAMFSDTE